MSDGLPLMPVWLYRLDGPDGAAHEWYGAMQSVDATRRLTVIGVAFRPNYDPIQGAADLAVFLENVEQTAAEVRWFDDEVET